MKKAPKTGALESKTFLRPFGAATYFAFFFFVGFFGAAFLAALFID